MPESVVQNDLPPAKPTATTWYSYAIIRVVPRVERGEYLNVGVLLFARTRRFLDARIELDPVRLRALAPDADIALIERHLQTVMDICAGKPAGGPVAALPPSERFHWLTAPRSTVIQTSPVHEGHCTDPEAALAQLVEAYVRVPTG